MYLKSTLRRFQFMERSYYTEIVSVEQSLKENVPGRQPPKRKHIYLDFAQ